MFPFEVAFTPKRSQLYMYVTLPTDIWFVYFERSGGEPKILLLARENFKLFSGLLKVQLTVFLMARSHMYILRKCIYRCIVNMHMWMRIGLKDIHVYEIF